MVLGFREWVLDVRDHLGTSPFLYSDLPDELQCRSSFLKATRRGYLQNIGSVMKPGFGMPSKVWKVHDELPRWTR